jgi:hypothetical protein
MHLGHGYGDHGASGTERSRTMKHHAPPYRALVALLAGLWWGTALAGPPPVSPASFMSPGTVPNVGGVGGVSYTDPTTRAPGPADNASYGFPLGALWLGPGGIYSASQVTPYAVWQPSASPVLPLTAMPNALVACSLDQLSPSYTANKAIDVVRASDSAVLTVGFVQKPPYARLRFDDASAAAFLFGTTGAVSKCYDQSGNGNDLVQATAANRPLLTYMPMIGWAINTVGQYAGGVTTLRSLSVTLASAISPSVNAVLAVSGLPRSTTETDSLLGVGTGSNWALLGSYLHSPGMSILSKNVVTPLPASPTVAVFTQLSIQTNNISANNAVSTALQNTPNATASTTLTLGATTILASEMALRSWIYYSRAWTATEVIALRASLSALHSVPFQTSTDILVNHGDSITFGLGAADARGWSAQMQPMLSRPMTVYNTGWPGQQLTLKLPTEAAWFASIYSATARNFIVNLLWGTNDIVSGGRTAVQVYADLQTDIALIKALGPNVKVNVGTLLPRGSITTAQIASTTALNTMIVNGYNQSQATGGLGADGLIDYASDALLATCNTSQVVCSDNLHPTTLGNTNMAALAAQATNAVMR